MVIAGASGFVGRGLISALSGSFNIIGLSRSAVKSTGAVTWRVCDLFSLEEAESALKGCDIAIYLVHSMMPAATLTQGRFDDLDLVIADNFSRAANKNGVKKIIYLGGIIPDGEISLHLKSRREVEDALSDYGVPCITLRAGLVVGSNGSSFEMMRKLVERLPMMICPKWTATRTQPIALGDVTTLLAKVAADDSLPPGAYDIGGASVLTYIEMMKRTSRVLGKRRFFVPVGLFSPKLSRLWVRLVTGAPMQLIGPLVESLRHPMVARDDFLIKRYGLRVSSFEESLLTALSQKDVSRQREPVTGRGLAKRAVLHAHENTVCSVQRLPLPGGQDARWLARKYAEWLVEFLFPVIRVRNDEIGALCFMLVPVIDKWSVCLLRLVPDAAVSSSGRQLFYIQGGLLLSSKGMAKGTFEFRKVMAGRYALAAIFDFIPALPWWLYKLTQAYFHLFVMWAFKRELARLDRAG